MTKKYWIRFAYYSLLLSSAAVAQNSDIAVRSPNGGEELQIGTTYRLRWATGNIDGNVRVELARDGGLTYAAINQNTNNDGNLNWNVSGPVTSQAKLRVTSTRDTAKRDASDGAFVIGNAVLFQVNMNVKMQEGAFLPAAGDQVAVVGNFNNWNPSTHLLTDDNGDGIYTGAAIIPTGVGGAINYKFWKTPRGGIENETISNRTYSIRSSNDAIAVAYFDNDALASLPPNPPALVSPANNATNQPTALTFQWSAPSGATSYGFQLATNSVFTAMVVNAPNLQSTSLHIDTLNIGTTYYWRVNATNSTGTSAYSTVRSFSTSPALPPAPILASPLNGEIDRPTTLSLGWNAVSGATSYRVQVSLNASFTSLVVNDGNVTTTSRQVGPLQNGLTYYWRVSAQNSGGVSPYSTVWQFTTLPAPPPTPSLLSPENGVTNQATSLLLSWRGDSTAINYHVQVSTSSTFGTLFLEDSSLTTTERLVSGMAFGTRYYWRVRAINRGGYSSFSPSRSFTTGIAPPPPPPAPILVSPANGATNQALLVVLDWNPATGATAYRPQVSTSSTFATLIYDDSSITTTSVVVGPLLTNTTYYWRVSARNSSGNGPFSTTWSFTTIPLTPLSPALASPNDGAIDQPKTLTLAWNATPGAMAYRLQVSTSATFSTTEIDDSSLATTTRQVGPLLESTTYHWRVSARNIAGYGPFSDAWTFNTEVDPPPEPRLTTPANNSIDQPTTLTLRWDARGDPTLWQVQVSTSSTFSTLIVNNGNVTQSSLQIGPLARNTKYYWRVRASKRGEWGNYSGTWSFTTVANAPAVPVLLSPPNGSTGQPTTVILNWTAVQDASAYRLQVARSSNFLTMVLDADNITATSRQVGSLSNNETYYWRVQAKNGGGTSSYTGTWSFTTDPGLPAAPAAPSLSAPQNGSSGETTTLTLSWNASSGASSYGLQVSTSETFVSIIVGDGNVTGTTREVTGLATNTRYYWRVNARNAGGTSGYSTTWNFTTGTTSSEAPAAPTLASPTNNSTGQPLSLTLQWNSSDRAISYRLQVATNSSFSSIVVDDDDLNGTTKDVGPLSPKTTYFWRVRAKNSRGNSSYSSTWRFTTADRSAVVIAPTFPPPVAGENLNVRIPIPSTFQPTTSVLYYRNGGERSFKALSFSNNGSELQAAIPSAFMNIRGIEYYVQLSDGQTQVVFPSTDPVNSPEVIRVDNINEKSPLTFRRKILKMISVPAVLKDSTIEAVLGDDFGSYNASRWRLFRWRDTSYTEYPEVGEPMSPGKAFWIVTNDGQQFDIDNAKSMNSAQSFSITLKPGWNQVGNPFAFPVSWSDIMAWSQLGNTSVQQPVYWDSDAREYIYNVDVIAPWEGYFVYSRATFPITITIPAREAAPSAGKVHAGAIGTEQASYSLNVSATQSGTDFRDSQNFLGFASSDMQSVTLREAPPAEKRLNLSIINDDIRDGRQLAASYKPVSGDGATWDVEIESAVKEGNVFLSLNSDGQLPDGFNIYLFDTDNFTIVPAGVSGYAVEMQEKLPVRHLRIVIGTEQYAGQQSGGIPLVPVAFALEQNYPNPFNPETQIRYQLGKRSMVQLAIYNITGELVTTLVDGEQLTGSHTTRWDGISHGGFPAASGMYILRLKTDEFTASRKLLLIR